MVSVACNIQLIAFFKPETENTFSFSFLKCELRDCRCHDLGLAQACGSCSVTKGLTLHSVAECRCSLLAYCAVMSSCHISMC